MAQRINGIYRLVTIPLVYKTLMSLLGSDRASRRYVNAILKVKPGDRILDVGCGPARLLSYLPDVDYTGMDLNPAHIDDARSTHGSRGRFVVGNAATDIPPEWDRFDIINILALMHHLDDDECRSLLSSLKTILAPGGRIVTLDCVWLPNQRLVAKFLNQRDSGLCIRTPDAYLRLFDGLGFDVRSKTYHDLLNVPYDHFAITATAP